MKDHRIKDGLLRNKVDSTLPLRVQYEQSQLEAEDLFQTELPYG
jgi:hypothetical protein